MAAEEQGPGLTEIGPSGRGARRRSGGKRGRTGTTGGRDGGPTGTPATGPTAMEAVGRAQFRLRVGEREGEANVPLRVSVGERAEWEGREPQGVVASDDPAVLRFVRRALWQLQPPPEPRPLRPVPKPERRRTRTRVLAVVCPECDGTCGPEEDPCWLCAGAGVTTEEMARRWWERERRREGEPGTR